MNNRFLHAVSDAEQKNWCVRPYCTTCVALDFRNAVASIEDLQSELESIDLQELISQRIWFDAIRVTAIDNRISLNWGPILSSWLPFAQEGNIGFADYVLFYIVNRVPCDRQTHANWLDTCINLALRYKHASLLESLVRILGPSTENYNNLFKTALERSPQSPLLKNALIKAGLVPSEDDVRRELKRKTAGNNLFGAIRRNDIKAVHALLARRADLKVKNQEGRTPLEYANSLERADLVAMIESAIAKQNVQTDTEKSRR